MNELKAAYAKLGGFTASYSAEGPGKTVEVKMGLDEMSGICALHVLATSRGVTMDIRQWATEDDEIFVDAGQKELIKVSGLRTEIKSLNELLKLLGFDPDQAGEINPHQSTPVMLLSKEGINAGVGLVELDQPSWKEELKDAVVKEAGEKSVIFQTKESGTLEISRENGLLLKQVIPLDEGQAIMMELTEVTLNPGAEAVSKISEGWKTDGAKVAARGSMLGPLRMKVFQLLIKAVEDGHADLEKLGKRLEEQREPLRRFAEGLTGEVGGALAADETWKKMLDDVRTKVREKYRKDNAEATDEQAGKFVDAFVGSSSNRAELRDHIAKTFAGNKELRQILLFELSGKNRAVNLLPTRGEAGEAAREMIEIALFRAYAEAVLDKKMKQYWGEREGLE